MQYKEAKCYRAGKEGTLMYHILLVEDDQDLSTITHMNLARAGHKVDDAFSCAQAETLLS